MYKTQDDGNGPGQTRTCASNGSEPAISDEHGAECVALSDDSSHTDPQLQRLIGAWATLNQTAREQIEQIIEAGGGDQSTTTTPKGATGNE